MNFETAVAFVIEDEGGYVNHPQDPGGETKYGISKRSYPGLDIKNLTVSEAQKIYRDDFWMETGIDRLPEHLRYMMFDMSVNHGPHKATRILQRALKLPDDGIIGPATINASNRLKLIDLAKERSKYFIDIVESKPSQIAFLEGWINRVFKILGRSVK